MILNRCVPSGGSTLTPATPETYAGRAGQLPCVSVTEQESGKRGWFSSKARGEVALLLLAPSRATPKIGLAGLAVLGLALGCDRLPWEDPPAPPLVAITGPIASSPRPFRDQEPRPQEGSVPAARSMPEFERRDCPDTVIAATTPDPDARIVSVTLEDPRTQRRNLVAPRIIELVQSSATHPGVAAADSRDGSELAATSSRYVGVLFVTDYAPPRLIIRMGKLRHEWLEGVMTARLAIFDAQSGEALCAVPIVAHSDTREAPVRVRLQGDTRVRLEKQLGQLVQDAARKGLAEISKTLRWPELPRVDTDDLWGKKPKAPPASTATTAKTTEDGADSRNP
jgi:hypothetical protein